MVRGGSFSFPPPPRSPSSRAHLFLPQGKAREPSKSHRFRKTAATVTHLCGLVLSRKRYIERSPVVQWATFQLKRQMNFKNDNLFSISDYSKKQFQKKGFEKLKHLLNICPKQRRQQDILKIQACLKTNRAFQCLPSKTQLQLCQAFIYQEYEAGTIIIRQGYVATECYLVLSGKLKIIMADAKFLTPEILYEAEEGDFIGETCLLTNTRRPATVICKSDAELVVIDKEDFKHILAELKCEQHHTTCHFLRKLPLFSTWLPGKIDFLLHCSLQRFYRAGTTVVIDSLNSYFLVIVKSIAAVTYCSPEARKVFSEQENKGSEGKYDNGIKRIRRKTEVKVASLPPRFLKIRTLQQSDIFGLAEIMDRFCGLQLSLISEGAECVFIPKRLFLLEAPPKSKRIALEMASSYPQKNMIQESYIIQQLWSIYKSKLIGQHLESCARLASPSTSVW
ncbi:cyclic nucleotide-binding domain-containing protein 2-like isoform X4 [Rhineura floridana]|uniref:cyclic nucleotide-binding domain-containing protein 2-like isoform X4 n=1 Tax=Rhineura floridana TaxID=261503 RepID=UPI002AC807A0|nr:cyclic nucleotide-binding domain-containing protein 2-like isoform X4 [Rhineura floridana]